MLEDLPRFGAAFLSALGVNFGIAAASVLGGLVFGLPLAAARLAGGLTGRACGLLVATLRAAPTFVVMFFLLNALPQGLTLGGWQLRMTPWMSVVMSLAIYATAYVADNALDAAQQWRAGSKVAAMLFPMGLVRAFFVMVLSSGFGAAVGVIEATTVTLRELERLDGLRDRLLLMAAVMVVFVLIFQSIYAVIDALRRTLVARFARRDGSVAATAR